MSFTHDPAYILAILFCLIVTSEWLAKLRFLSHLGSVLIVIIAAAVFANIGLIPSSQAPSGTRSAPMPASSLPNFLNEFSGQHGKRHRARQTGRSAKFTFRLKTP